MILTRHTILSFFMSNDISSGVLQKEKDENGFGSGLLKTNASRHQFGIGHVFNVEIYTKDNYASTFTAGPMACRDNNFLHNFHLQLFSINQNRVYEYITYMNIFEL